MHVPLQVLGDGELPFPLTIKAETFSKSAREKIEAGGEPGAGKGLQIFLCSLMAKCMALC